MGGILGLLGEGTADELRAMGARMSLRGPLRRVQNPAAGVWLGECGGGESGPSGRAVGDCQLENADELRDLLAERGGHQDVQDDAGLVAALVSESGLEALNRLRGYFAVAFWDERERALVLACDQAGFKTLNYATLQGRFIFASDYKAFLALPDFVAAPDRDVIQHYLASRQLLLGRPMMAGVTSLTAGQALLCKDGRFEKRQYWRPMVHPVRRTAAGHAAVVRQAFLDVVRKQSRPYSRIGLTLSGGLDSPAALAALRHVRPEAEIVTFTAGQGDDDPEIVGARRVAEHFGTEHHELQFRPETIPRDLPRLVWLMEDSSGREEALLLLQVLEEAGKHVRVVMGGYAADAVFGGMPRYHLVRLAAEFPMLKRPLAELYQFTQVGTPPASWLGRLMKRAVYRGADYPPPAVLGATRPASVPWPEGVNDLLIDGALGITDFGGLEPTYEVARLAFLTPYLDPDLVSLALTVPERFKVGLRRGKLVMRWAMSDLLPREITRRPKGIQRVHHDQRLSDVLDGMADDLLTPEMVRKRGFIDPSYLTRLRRRPGAVAYRTEAMYRLFTLLSVEVWVRQFIDGQGAPRGF